MDLTRYPRVLCGALMLAAIVTTTPASARHADGAIVVTAKIVDSTIATPAEPDAIPLLKVHPIGRLPEIWQAHGGDNRVVRNVSYPTLTPVLPDPAKATGAAVIVAPGGGFFFMLSIDSEGYKVAHWLADRGVAAFVLKYRTEETPVDGTQAYAAMGARMAAALKGNKPIGTTAEALDDAKAAVRLVRARSSAWHIDPERIGFVGFSAGAMTALSVGTTDDLAARPDFIAAIYPPMTARAVPADAPPMFVAIALDDPLSGHGPLGLIDSWRDAKRPLEVHLFERGGHGFGMDGRSAGSRLWIDAFYAWLKDREIIPG